MRTVICREDVGGHLYADVFQASQAADALHELAGADAAAAGHGVGVDLHATVLGRHRVDDRVASKPRHIEQVLRRLRNAFPGS